MAKGRCAPCGAHIRGLVMTELEHRFDHCTGNWRLIGTGDERAIRCDGCEAELLATSEHRLAAIDENYAGIYLRRLAAEGVAFLDADGRGDR
jgi:hypothetical protein